MDDKVVIGEVISIWGLQGALRIHPLTDFMDRFKLGAKFLIGDTTYTIESSHTNKGNIIIKLKDINSPEAAAELCHQLMEIPESQLMPLPDGVYYQFQIIGLKVVTTNGLSLGKITQILDTASNDVYVIKSGKKDILIPAVKDVIKNINLAQGYMTIEAIDGLLD